MKQNLTQYVMVIMLVVGAYFLGVYKTKTEYLEKSPNTVAQVEGAPVAPVAKPIDMAQVDALFANESNLVFGGKMPRLNLLSSRTLSCPFCHVAAGLNPGIIQGGKSTICCSVAEGGTYVPPVLEMKKLIDAGEAALLGSIHLAYQRRTRNGCALLC